MASPPADTGLAHSATLLDASIDSIVVVDTAGIVAEWNQAAEHLLGWSHREATGRPLVDIAPELVPASGHQETVSRLARRDGSVVHTEQRSTRFAGGTVVVIRDVTERLLLDEVAAAISQLDPKTALVSFAERLRDTVPFATLDLDVVENGKLRRVVEAGADRGDDQAAGTVHDLVGTASAVLVEHAWAHVLPLVVEDTAEHRYAEDTHLEAVGVKSYVVVPLLSEQRVYGTLTAGFLDAGGPAESIVELLASIAVAIAQGVKNVLTFEREREEIRRLAELDRLKDEFLSGVSHELRTPLAALKGFVQLVLLDWAGMDDDEKQQLLQRAYRNAEDLGRLVEQLLDFSRLAEDRARVSARAMPLRPEVDELLDRLSSVLSSHEVVVEIADDLRPLFDAHGLERILTNLLSNAVKFSPAGSTLRIVADPEATPGEVVVSVADEGTGIPAEHQQLVFDRFFQSGPAVSSRRGTGIGLAIVKRYTELLGGRVWVESEPGQGSTFFFTLPLA